MNFKKYLIILSLLVSFNLQAKEDLPSTFYTFKLPEHSKIISPLAQVEKTNQKNIYKVIFQPTPNLPFQIIVEGPLGGRVRRTITSMEELKNFQIEERVIFDPNPNPPEIFYLPKLCPRLKYDETKSVTGPYFYYDASKDSLNAAPFIQNLDPDFFKNDWRKARSELDNKNVLMLKKVTLSYDYEDDRIVDYQGPHPIYKDRPHVVFEGQGGFYGNLHYAIMPYDLRYKNLDKQTLLHLVQGSLDKINREDLRPKLRVHSFIPGPFFSAKKLNYDLCEWGDTTYQAPKQTLHYQGMSLWDWDFSVKNAQRILLVIWEGDEEGWMYRNKILHPNYLTDDLVAVFEIERIKTLSPLVLVNEEKTIEIVLETKR